MAEESATPSEDATTDGAPTPGGVVEGTLREVRLDEIDFEDQSLMFRTALRTGPLQKSLKSEGLQIPVVLRGRTRGQKSYQIISGFRRCTAAQELKWDTITALVRPSEFSDEDAFKASVLENTERKTYSDIDRAYVIREYGSRGLGSLDVGELMGLSKRQINNLKSLLELPDDVQAAIDDAGQHFSATHGLTLKKMSKKYPEMDFAGWVKKVNEEELSVAKLARAVNTEYRVKDAPSFTSIFNTKATKMDAGEIRLSPVKFTVAELSDDEKAALKKELQALLKQL